MSDKLRPCPLCGGAIAVHPLGPQYVRCANGDCLLFGSAMDHDAWNALPRPSEAAREIAGQLRRFAGNEDWEYANGDRVDLQGIADRIESLAAAQAPGKVWIYKNTLNAFLIGMRTLNPLYSEPPMVWASPPDENPDDYVAIPVHGEPEAASMPSEAAFLSSEIRRVLFEGDTITAPRFFVRKVRK